MKLGEGGEAFFVFETSDAIPESMQTSPVISPTASPESLPAQDVTSPPILQEPDYLDLNIDDFSNRTKGSAGSGRPLLSDASRAKSDFGTVQDKKKQFRGLIVTGAFAPMSTSPGSEPGGLANNDLASQRLLPSQIKRSASDELLTMTARSRNEKCDLSPGIPAYEDPQDRLTTSRAAASTHTDRSVSPPLLSANDAIDRAKSLSKKLSLSQIPTRVTANGDLMLDMKGYKSSEDEAIRAEIIARKILSEELEGNYDIGALIGADDQGNLWIYSSEEAKEAAGRKLGLQGAATGELERDAASDSGYHSDSEKDPMNTQTHVKQRRTQSDAAPIGLATPPQIPPAEVPSSGDPNRNYAKTLRLTSDQLKALNLKPGENTMSFSVNRATCQAYMFYWTYDVPIVISDIDGTITKYALCVISLDVLLICLLSGLMLWAMF